MAYFTGAADNLTDLLGKIRVAAEASGWVTDRYTQGVEWFVRNADASSFFALRIRQNGSPDNNYANYDCIFITGSTAYDPNKSYLDQPGSNMTKQFYGPITKFRPYLIGPFTRYHVFTTQYYIHVILEVMAGTYCYMLIGDLDKDETVYQGGQYIGGHYYNNDPTLDFGTSSDQNGINSSIRMFPFDNAYPYYSNSFVRTGAIDDMAADYWGACAHAGGYGQGKLVTMGAGGQDHPNAGLLYASYNSLNDSTLLVPATMFVVGAQGRLRYIGKMRDFAYCQITGLAPGDTVKYGNEEWVVFPPYRVGTNGQRTSLDQGYAFRKVA